MRLSKLSYYADFFISLAIIAVMASLAAVLPTWLRRGEWVLFVVAGALAWTFIEYLVHRWLYHHAPFFREMHDMHHNEPHAHIGAPPIIGIVLIFAIFYAPLLTVNAIAASGVTVGILIGYVGYMVVHHAAHYWSMPQSSWLYQLRRHHALHHHHAEDCNFGITTSLWDRVFGTAVQTSRATAPT